MARSTLLLALLAASALRSAAVASAQPPSPSETATVVGTVRDADGAPLPGVNVYLSGTARGAATDADGRYEVARVPPGAYRVVASMLGFGPSARGVRLGAGDRARVDFALAEAPLALGAVRVEAERDGRWERHLARFTTTLLGESANADSTALLNPEVLDFRSRWGTLTATARAPLVVENRALGYRLTYDLTEFSASATRVSYDGDERFEPLAPADSAEARRWADARARAYRGSLGHLLQALLAGTAEADGFSFTVTVQDSYVGRPGFRTSGARLMRRNADGWGTLRFRGRLDVVYTGEPEEPEYLTSEWFHERRGRPDEVQRSALVLDGYAVRIDPQGTPEVHDAVTSMGHMAFERLADRVPEEYRLPDAER